MTLIEALKSGRRFRPKGSDLDWYTPGLEHRWSDRAVLDEWEVEEPVIELTSTGFWERYKSAVIAVETCRDIQVWELNSPLHYNKYLMQELHKRIFGGE